MYSVFQVDKFFKIAFAIKSNGGASLSETRTIIGDCLGVVSRQTLDKYIRVLVNQKFIRPTVSGYAANERIEADYEEFKKKRPGLY